MEEWKTYKLGSLCRKVCSGGTPKSTCEQYYGGSIPWLNTKEVNFNRIYSTESTITQSGLDSSAAKWIDENAVVVAMYGNTAGKVALSKIRLTTNQACCNLMIDESKADYRFIFYYLMSKYVEIKAKANGAAQQNLNAQQIKDLEIPLPPLVLQRQISGILSSLDDKIELNNRINHNLEEQVQALFDSFVASDNGLGYHQLSEIAVINPARTLSKNTVARCIDMSFLSTSGTFPSGWEYKPYSGGMKFQNGDTIMARITPCLENGKAGYINFLDSNETAFGSTEYIVLSAKEGYPSEMFYFLTRNADFIDYAVKNMNGSSGRQRVSGETIGKYSLPVLTTKQLSDLQIHCSEAMKNICNNCLENRLLVSTRDSLLPKLMSGELTC